MNFWTRFLIAIGAIEEQLHHVLHPINKMTEKCEDIASRERLRIIESKIAIDDHTAKITAAETNKAAAEESAVAIRRLFLAA